MIRIVILILIFASPNLVKAQNVDSTLMYYSQALEYLKRESSYGKPKERYSKLRVSPQVVHFDILGWFLQSEVSKKITDYVPKSKFSDDDYQEAIHLERLTDGLKKSKCQLFFSEIRNNMLLTEVIRETNSSDYRTASMFGEGTVFLFEFTDGKLTNVVSKNVRHN